jgi:group I intron endonuclease
MYIYKITNNINGKSYIGLKSKTVEESKNYYGSGTLINQAIDKYGKENFTKEILERNINSHEILNDQEIYWIEYFNTFNNGYNLTKGGQGNLGRVTSEETKAKLRESAKQQFRNGVSEETRERIRQNAIGRKNPHSKDTKAKLSKAATGRIMSQEERDKMAKTHRIAKTGKPLPVATEPCRYCGRIMAKSHMTRWHNDKCKNKS